MSVFLVLYKHPTSLCWGIKSISVFVSNYFLIIGERIPYFLFLFSVCVRSIVVFIWYREQGSKGGGDRPRFSSKKVDQRFLKLIDLKGFISVDQRV